MIQIAFLWHMHQPLYLDPATGVSVLPWVRLHATRAYYDMIRVAADYPDVHLTFNLVPVLMKQLQDLVEGGRDHYRELAAKPADALTETEARFLIEQFFQASWGTLVLPNSGYRRLLELRGGEFVDADAVHRFKPQDLRDLQVWFNLAWFGFTALREYPALAELRARQQGFTEADKDVIFQAQDEIVARILPLYAEARQKGHIEISATPYYHPILPLVCDTNLAARAMPHTPLPHPPFQHPEDAAAQVERACRYHEAVFGLAPAGMWPAEGSVSPEIVPILSQAGLKWFATSEGILHHSSLDEHSRPPHRDLHGRASVLTPYLVGDTAAFFRHLELSDLIGFTYSRAYGPEAASDLIGRVRQAAQGFHGAKGRPPLVPIILDGENPWEHYPDGGEGFLRSLYQGILEAPDLRAVTFSEHLEAWPAESRIKQLWSGSWIGSTYGIWIGHPEDVVGWQRLREARDFFSRAEKAEPPPDPEALEAARESLYAAEGSDWFWWYGDEFSSQSDHEFDRLFRANLSNVYERLGAKPPGNLSIPIKGLRRFHHLPPPRAVVRPTVDGHRTTFYEWADAGEVPLKAAGGAMARGAQLLRKMGYGFDERSVNLRFDFGRDLLHHAEEQPELELIVLSPVSLAVRVPLTTNMPVELPVTWLTPETMPDLPEDLAPALEVFDSPVDPAGEMPKGTPEAEEMKAGAPGGATSGDPPRPGGNPFDTATQTDRIRAASGEVIEVAMPRDLLRLQQGGVLEFFLAVKAGKEQLARYPGREIFQMEVPSWDRMMAFWNV